MDKKSTLIFGGLFLIWLGLYFVVIPRTDTNSDKQLAQIGSFDSENKESSNNEESEEDSKLEVGPTENPDGTLKIWAYYNNNLLDPSVGCSTSFPIERTVPKNDQVIQAAIAELLKGLTPKESAEGYYTSLSPGIFIHDLRVEEGTAFIDFNSHLAYNIVPDSCRAKAIRAQLEQTATQFPTIDDIVVLIDGVESPLFN